ncbi:MAG TPA: ATP-binding cassette domain-containing protein, partial [Baekduia sp.]|nr:ATP-binding cassette domain-containing protein [Baekduia sp.]
ASNGLSQSRVDEVLDIVGIKSVASKRIKGFSLGMSQRLGIAAALLGDPKVLMFDEPVNGLDPEGIAWIRTFMRSLAAEGRTVLVSSHLMSEMALTADHLVVIGRGKLLADVSTEDFISQSKGSKVRVRSPQQTQLHELLNAHEGVTVSSHDDHLSLTGATCEQVGDLAASNSIVIHGLFEDRASLEAAFMEMTADDVEYRAVES